MSLLIILLNSLRPLILAFALFIGKFTPWDFMIHCAANIWKATARYCRSSCAAVGSNPRNRFAASVNFCCRRLLLYIVKNSRVTVWPAGGKMPCSCDFCFLHRVLIMQNVIFEKYFMGISFPILPWLCSCEQNNSFTRLLGGPGGGDPAWNCSAVCCLGKADQTQETTSLPPLECGCYIGVSPAYEVDKIV